MKIEKIRDYAYPCMMAEKALKNVYNLMQEDKSNKAITQCFIAIDEIKNIIIFIQNEKIKTSINS